MHRARTALSIALALVGFAACGGSVKPASPPANGGEGAGVEPGAKAKTKDELHEEAMRACVTDDSVRPFCECRFQVVSSELTVEEMNQRKAPEQKIARADARIRKECSNKLDEATIKGAFLRGCVKDKESHRPICECVWPRLRKRYELSDLADGTVLQSDEMRSLLKESVRACASTSGEDTARESFMQACAEKPGFGPYCACAWKQLRAQLSLEQIATESDPPSDAFKSAALAARQKCQGLHP